MAQAPRSGGTDAPEKPVIVVHGGAGRVSVDSLRELWIFREVLRAFTLRYVKVKYKQAALGVGWAVLQPVVSALVFAVFIGRFASVSSEGVSYTVFALAGTVAWSYFSTASGSAMESLVNDAGMLRKVYFPREVLPLAAVVAALVDFVPALVALLMFVTIDGIGPSLTWLALPVPIATLALTATAAGLGLSGMNVYYRDVRYVLPFALQLGLFASPVIFSLGMIPSSWRAPYAILNPCAAAIDSLRRITLHRQWPDAGISSGALLVAGAGTVVAYAFFKRLERGFSDRV